MRGLADRHRPLIASTIGLVGCVAIACSSAPKPATRAEPSTKVYRVGSTQVSLPTDWRCKATRCYPPASLAVGKCILTDELAKDDLRQAYNALRPNFLRIDIAEDRPATLRKVGDDNVLNVTWSRPGAPVRAIALGREVAAAGTKVAALCTSVPQFDEEACVDVLDSLAIGTAGAGQAKAYQRGVWAIRVPHVTTVKSEGKKPGDYEIIEAHKLGSHSVTTVIIAKGHTVASLFSIFNRVKNSRMSPARPLPERAGIYHANWTLAGHEWLLTLRLMQRGRHRIGAMCALEKAGAGEGRSVLARIVSSLRFAPR